MHPHLTLGSALPGEKLYSTLENEHEGKVGCTARLLKRHSWIFRMVLEVHSQ